MAALTADKNTGFGKSPAWDEPPVKASTTIYKGAAVCIDTSVGYAVPAADTSGLVYRGQALAGANNASGSSGDISVKVEVPRNGYYVAFACTSAAQTWQDKLVSFLDDQTVALPASTTNKICAGRVKQVLSATSVLVDTSDRAAQPLTSSTI